ncbi:MAG: amidohydrolase family protein [Thermomicrobiales bacterium]|nr:amidohydrolase family protein [Thermomicrobiales bacterium]
MSTTAPIIDAHMHLWKRSNSTYSWLGNVDEALQRDFSSELAEVELRSAGVSSAILVQADDTHTDTAHMLSVAETHSWVAGVVAWVPLEHPDEAERKIGELSQHHPKVRGIRQLIHDDPRPGLLNTPSVRETLGIIANHQLAFDVPDAWPRDLPSVKGVADQYPSLPIVVDHLGKPPAQVDHLPAWAEVISELAQRPDIFAKLSGLHYLGDEQLSRVWEIALEAFGPERLLWGSDWPMSVPHGGYRVHARRIWSLLDELTDRERRAILGDTARRVYKLEV